MRKQDIVIRPIVRPKNGTPAHVWCVPCKRAFKRTEESKMDQFFDGFPQMYACPRCGCGAR